MTFEFEMDNRMVRKRYIKIRVSEDELEMIKAKADMQGCTVSDLLRYLVLNMRVRNTEHDKEVIRYLARIGSNINQIARWANKHKGRAPSLETVLWLNRIYRAVVKSKNEGSK